MTFAKFSKWAIFTALIVAGSMGAPTHAQAAGGSGGVGGDIIVFDIVDSLHEDQSAAGGGGQDIIVFDIADSFADDSDDTEESNFQPDPEYKYVPVRR